MAGSLTMSVSARSVLTSDAPTLRARRSARLPRRWPARAGEYELVRFASAGGMGIVFEALERTSGARVALKFMDPDAHYPNKDTRFSREIIALRSLCHGNTARYVGSGYTDEGLRFLAMEYGDGITLSELVAREGPLPPGRALGLLRQLCDSIAEVHAAGMAHRDLKPSNVMVTRRIRHEDWVKVIDFGLVKLPGTSSDADTTLPGLFLGTPGYAPPEVWSPKGAPEARGDVYGIGLIAHHLLTSCSPPDPVETLVNDSRRIISDLQRRTPAWLVSAIACCLSTDPSARFADAGALSRALRAA